MLNPEQTNAFEEEEILPAANENLEMLVAEEEARLALIAQDEGIAL